MNRRNRKTALLALCDLLALSGFVAMFYIIGTLANGGAPRLALWAVPVLAGLSLCARLYEKI